MKKTRSPSIKEASKGWKTEELRNHSLYPQWWLRMYWSSGQTLCPIRAVEECRNHCINSNAALRNRDLILSVNILLVSAQFNYIYKTLISRYLLLFCDLGSRRICHQRPHLRCVIFKAEDWSGNSQLKGHRCSWEHILSESNVVCLCSRITPALGFWSAFRVVLPSLGEDEHFL